jgi:primosomal protein N' (replication factor Y)
MYYYLVAPITVIRAQEPAFTYQSSQLLEIGTITSVSVGKKNLTGVVVKNVKRPTFTTKPIEHIIVDKPLPTPIVSLANWMSDYYSTHLALVLQTILPTGLQKQRRDIQVRDTAAHRARTNIVLNHEQQAAIDAITEHSSGTLLLHGVPGSGKTQVYIESAKRQLADGLSTIVLVPEIALTPQLVAEFTNHFPHVVVTHSRMTEAERHKAWLEVLHAKQPLIIIGPRSALFMPVGGLGLIVVDEAHEPSYKQDQSPRYSALRTASVLAKLHTHAKVVLGSATPSVSDYYLAEQTKSPIIRLTKPAVATEHPTVELIDLRRKDLFREHRFLSDALLARIREALQQKKQTLLFHNRRGTAPTTLCSNCGWSALCSTCFMPMTLHADKHKLLCHICGNKQEVPPNCPECANPSIVFRGIGTKMIEDEVRKAFPKATIGRFDADNTADQTLDKRYQEIYDGHIDILIGTQILAKGLDVPRLSVVGVLQADNGLHLPDYQAEERVFQLLYQVAGRVGRGKHESHVVVQTFLPKHPTIRLALERNYDDFYRQQLHERQRSAFPPFTYLLKLTTSYKTEAGAIRAARTMAAKLRSAYPHLIIQGPTPAFYERMHGNYRWQLLLKSKKRSELATIARSIPAGWQVDLDAANLL